MDIIRFHNPTSPTKLEQGEIVNGLTSKMWIERYLEAGEFTFIANADTGMRDKLPIGSLISHIDTEEVMIVENHEINEVKGQPAEIVITGRGFETFLENRIVGSNLTFPFVGIVPDYVLPSDNTWNHAVTILNDHILAVNLIDDDDSLSFVEVINEVVGSEDLYELSIPKGTLYERLLEILQIANLGIRVVRPNVLSPLGPTSPNLALVVHRGVNRTAEIIFSHDTGEIESADYLWSNKPFKNSVLVSGRWVQIRVDTVDSEYDRRMMYLNASDIDEGYSEEPAGGDLDLIILKMQQRGIMALSSQTNIALTKTEVSKEGTKATYRVDFNVGDLITINGDYNETTIRQVSEYVEIEDKTGKRAYPTLTMI